MDAPAHVHLGTALAITGESVNTSLGSDSPRSEENNNIGSGLFIHEQQQQQQQQHQQQTYMEKESYPESPIQGDRQVAARPSNERKATSTIGNLMNRVMSRRSEHTLHDPTGADPNEKKHPRYIPAGEEGSSSSDYPDETDSFERAISRRSAQAQEGWTLEKVMKREKERDEKFGRKPRRLDVAWKGLCVRGVGADAVYAPDLPSMFNPATKKKDKARQKALQAKANAEPSAATSKSKTSQREAEKALPDLSDKLGPNEKFLLQDFTGCLKSGEMALVLGRPGAGCTTFLKALTNIKQGYAGVDGEITYGTLDSKQAERYPGQIIFVTEDEVFYPDLTVDETIKFALKMRTPSAAARPDDLSREEAEAEYRETLLKTFGIEHTVDTKVGDEHVRGVSGGERKRVTLAEALVNRAPVIAFDQPTRGLDASTALEFTKSMRTIVDYTKTTCFISVYQAGNQITECFDKVLVIAAGRCIYWGPMKEARPYFENLGFVVSPGANLSDFLTAVTVATERVIKDGQKGSVPNTPEEFSKVYLDSEINQRMVAEYDALMADEETRKVRTADFEENVKIEKSKRAGKKGPYTTTLWTQVLSATRRQYALTWNDKASLFIKQGGCLIQSLILGSLFYMLPSSTSGLFGKAGVLFLILLVNALLGLGEVVNSFKGRTILAKHKSMALYRPSALILAQVMVDIPIVALQVTIFIVPIYFMSGLTYTAGAFFTLWIVTYVTTHSLLGFFRMVGFGFSSFQASGAISGLALGLIIITMGYLLPSNQIKPWMGWIRWLNPLYYALESAFINEFKGQTIPCEAPYLIPYGQGYPTSGDNVVCTIAGGTTGSTDINGMTYLEAQYGYQRKHLWRNFGIVIVWWIFYLAVTCFCVERLKAAGSVKSFLLFRRPAKESADKSIKPNGDAESGPDGDNQLAGVRSSDNDDDMKIDKSDTLFAWKNLNYTVQVKGGKRQLLKNVQGFTKPGSLVALMGASGAGKTTLLDVLGARKEDGEIEGEITVDGRPPGPSFQRTCGYVGQMDIHEPTQTIREAFLFSARLRQPKDTPLAEIETYVDKVIDVLELNELADAVIGVPGAGLSIEQRKRTTIGVELVARPKLLFLDEPTSGLDGQSAFQILRFLKKLSAAGQSMLVTVHQPSALLFEQFDQLLLLAKGGRTVYNGPLGKHASTMKEYFEKHGAHIADGANPAEEMIDIVSGTRSKDQDWAQVWLDSEEYKQVTKEVEDVNREAKDKPPSFEEDGLYYAAPFSTQIKLVTARSFSSILRSPDYVLGRVGLIVGSGLITGLSFLQMKNDYKSVQNRLFAVFNAMFVAPGLFNIIQPRVIQQRTLYESREKQSKIFGWFPWVFGLIVTEMPWMFMSCVLSWTTWYLIAFPVGQMTDPQHGGAFFTMDILYFFWIAGFAQFIGVLCPTAESAALLNSVPLGLMAAFAGVLLPYPSIPAWWRYWIYYLDPWSYILGGKVFFVNRNVNIECDADEFNVLQAPSGQTCGAYMANFINNGAGYLSDPTSTGECQYCPYSSGNEYLETLGITSSVIGWRNVGITAIWVFAFWGFTVAAFGWRNRKA